MSYDSYKSLNGKIFAKSNMGTEFFSFIISNPEIAIKVALKQKLSNKQKNQVSKKIISVIENKIGSNKKSILRYNTEFLEGEFISHITQSLDGLENSGAFNPTFQGIIYSIIRYFKPEIVIETGVANGVSSTIILNSLLQNKRGKLYSIDLPTEFWEKSEYRQVDKVKVKKNKSVGWIVPETLRNNWVLNLGSSKEVLPELLKKIKQVDVFFHDSEHSYENMLFEFNTVFPQIKKKGIIISDDINRNKAFDDFVHEHKNEIVSIKAGQFGFIFKL
jgi:hypothetical protein